MLKKVIIILLFVIMIFLLCGCDSSSDHPLAMQTNNTKAYIRINEKPIVVDVEAYMNSSNGIITIYGIDGKTYKTHAANVILIKDPEGR